MARNVYALLVGIDDYPAPVPKLGGCRNDIVAIEALLRDRVAAQGDTLHVLRLLDGDATRAGVIGGFEEHLAQAGPDDVALFYYSGHGSQQPTPPEWWHLEPDRLDETLVLVDSRTEGGWDLADKELAALLATVGEANPHLLVVLDCCHSGSGTRASLEDGVAERRAPVDTRQRPVGTYLFGEAAAERLTRAVDERAALGESGWELPRAHHVLLAGCRNNETSKEHTVDDIRRGVLSLALERALKAGGASLTYRDVHRQVSSRVGQMVKAQHPQLETSSAGELDLPFLGGAVAPLPPSYVLTKGAAGWTIDGGLVHGVAAPVSDEFTLLAVYDAGGAAAGHARVTAVRPGDSDVEVTDGALDDDQTYRGVVTALPVPPIRILIEGDSAAAEALRGALAARDGANGPLVLVETSTSREADIAVSATPKGYVVRRSASQRDLCPRANTAAEALAVLEHVGTWLRLLMLSNGSTRLAHDAVTVVVAPTVVPGPDQDAWEVDGGYRFTSLNAEDEHGGRPYTVTITNHTKSPLWVGCLDLTDTYGVYPDAIDLDAHAGAVELSGGAQHVMRLSSEVPDVLWEQGISEVTDVLKVIVSTEEFDPRPLQLDDLEVGEDLRDIGRIRADESSPSTLDRLLRRFATRRARPQSAGEAVADWFTRDVVVVSERPHERVAIPDAGVATVAEGVQVVGHPGLEATIRLTTLADATRDVLVAPVPQALDGADAFGLVTARGVESDLALVLDIGEQGVAAVTPDAPLFVNLDRMLSDIEQVLPFAWDGAYYLPLGYAQSRAEGGSRVVIERLPEPIVTSRSLGGSIRILFRKLVGSKIGMPYDYPLLRQALVSDDGEVTYVAEAAVVKEAVSHASSVLIYVHGIIGDTEGMAQSARLSGSAPPLGDMYDVVLTLDYENLHTTIEENAAAFGKRLADVGLDAHHDKRLDIVAHSMGGLVSRYLIETVKGVKVSHLVTLGTPSGGSPWPTAEKWATVAVAFCINSMTTVAWPLKLLGSALTLVEKVDNALDQMEKDSPFLKALAIAPDPGVAYHVIVGDRSLVQHADAASLVRRLWPIASWAIDLAFFTKPNDIAVSVTSGQQFPTGRTPAITTEIVPSDHMSYFATDASLVALSTALTKLGSASV